MGRIAAANRDLLGAGASEGRRPITETDPTILADLERLVDDETRGNPELPLRWTSKSLRARAGALAEMGHRASHQTVAGLVRSLGFTLQSNRKAKEGSSHPDRDAQFRHIGAQTKAALDAGEPTLDQLLFDGS